jgi:hypothetical protein
MIEARRQTDPFIKFFILYMCLDAWMTSGSQLDSDSKKLDWLTNSENPLRMYWQESPHKTVPLNGLKKIGVIEDMRPNHRGEYIRLDDIGDFRQIVRFIYQIRCNLFHGGKSPINKSDKRLVALGAKLLAPWIEWTLIKTK